LLRFMVCMIRELAYELFHNTLSIETRS
jgi:hypothetical protein